MSDEKPIYVSPDNVSRVLGREAQRANIMAARVVGDIVKTTLGPKGMDKMLVDSTGNVIVTNDGVTILEEMEIEHPAAKMVVEIAKSQEKEVGDGTTTAAMLAGKLLEKAEDLLDKRIHPTVIAKGYEMSAQNCLDSLKSISAPVQDREVLTKIALTAMTGKGVESSREVLAKIIVDAADRVSEGREINRESIQIRKIGGGSAKESEMIDGFILDKERCNIDMPSKVENAKILLIDYPLEIKNTEIEAKISITSPEQLDSFLKAEEEQIKQISNKIIDSGCNVVFCQKGIDDVAQYYLAKAGIYACRRVPRDDMEKIAKATGGKIISNVNEINETLFGKAKEVYEYGEEDSMTFIRGCDNPKVVSILLKGGTSHSLDEIERSVTDSLGDVVSAIKSGRVVAGGGAVEMELSRRLRIYSKTLSGREQLAVEAFADALECIPEALAENAGMDPIDTLTEMRKRHEMGQGRDGLNLFENRVTDTMEAGIIEPMKVKTQAISSASEVAVMILRIDDVLVSRESRRIDNRKMGSYEGLD